MDNLDALIEMLVDEKGGTKEQYLSLMNKISHHESKSNPTIAQIGGGPGRGLFQFEVGKNAGGKTAANRTIRYLKSKGKSIPQWLKDTQKESSVDASTLTPQQQKVLFLGNMREHPTADFKKVWDGEETVEDFWANYHWAGKAKDEFKRRQSFQESLADYKEDPKKSFKQPELPLTERYADVKQPDATYTQPQKPYKQKTVPQQIPEYNVAEKPYLKLDQFNLEQSQPIKDNSLTKFDRLASVDKLLTNQLAMGGVLPNMSQGEFNSYNTGGTHETNPYGGIPKGMGSNGKMNTVEQGETSYDFKDGKYIFSNRIKL